MTTHWTSLYAARTSRLQSSTIRQLLAYSQQPGMISFAGGMPAAELFPLERFREAAARVLADPGSGQAALQYGLTEGYWPLREMIARHTARYGPSARPENVLITTGSQQALDLLGKLLVDRGDHVAVETPTYLGALQALAVYGANCLSLPADAHGLQTGDMRLAQVLNRRPKFMYLLPNFQNPSGVTLGLDRRAVVVALADKYGVPIVEDDPYGQLRYEGEHLPSLLKLDRDWHGRPRTDGLEAGNVIYLSTFSKTLAPGLRVGWVLAPQAVITRLAQLKQSADLHTSSFAQQLVFEVARGGFLDKHVRRLRAAYRQRRDTMLAALQAEMPPGASWTRPEGGLFIWLRLPEGLESRALLTAALKANVAFVPGDAFFAPDAAEAEARRCLRLNFSCAPPEQIVEGIRRLATAVRKLEPALA